MSLKMVSELITEELVNRIIREAVDKAEREKKEAFIKETKVKVSKAVREMFKRLEDYDGE